MDLGIAEDPYAQAHSRHLVPMQTGPPCPSPPLPKIWAWTSVRLSDNATGEITSAGQVPGLPPLAVGLKGEELYAQFIVVFMAPAT